VDEGCRWRTDSEAPFRTLDGFFGFLMREIAELRRLSDKTRRSSSPIPLVEGPHLGEEVEPENYL
jgi:hypothetical protein